MQASSRQFPMSLFIDSDSAVFNVYNKGMNNFITASLSPLPKELIECPLPYGLTWNDILPSLPGADAARIKRAHAYESHSKQGLNGGPNSCILLLRYAAEDGITREQTVFVKHTEDPNKTESERYRYLESRGVGVPRLLGVVPTGEGEVIIQEFLAQIGIDFSSDFEVTGLLHLIADLNTITDLPDRCQPWPGISDDQFAESLRSVLVEIAANPAMPEIDPQRWLKAYHATQRIPKTMPKAAIHNQMYFQQVGVAQRGDARQVVMFDLETLSPGARFTDIGGILYSLSMFTGRSQAELFGIYLSRYAHRTGHPIDFARAFHEMRTLRIPENFGNLPWLVDESHDPHSAVPSEELLLKVSCLNEDLRELGWIG
jgi:hypothetical protein